jgi:hypothetical protein
MKLGIASRFGPHRLPTGKACLTTVITPRMRRSPQPAVVFAAVVLAAMLTGCRDSHLNKPSVALLPQNPSAAAFIGDWGETEGGPVSYQIFRRGDGRAVIQSPANDTWWCEFRDVRFEGRSLLFALYNYTPRSSGYKTDTNPQGEHPFSGLRCDTRLEIDRADTNRIHVTMTTVVTTNGITGTLVRKRRAA